MNKVLNLNVNQAKSFLNDEVYESVKKEIVEAHKVLRAQTGKGNDFLGWLNLPVDIDLEEVKLNHKFYLQLVLVVLI